MDEGKLEKESQARNALDEAVWALRSLGWESDDIVDAAQQSAEDWDADSP